MDPTLTDISCMLGILFLTPCKKNVLTTGLSHPVLASLAGITYLAGRIAFAKGYYTGKPENRRWGSFGYIGLLTMLGCNIHTSLKFLGIA